METKMTIKTKLAVICTGLIFSVLGSCQRQQEESLETRMLREFIESSPAPDHVILNVTETPENSLAVNWRSDTSMWQGMVEIAAATHGPEFVDHTWSIQAKTETFIHRYQEEPEAMVNYHSAIIEDLDAGAKYVYRVGRLVGIFLYLP
jgi:hypothetical protein